MNAARLAVYDAEKTRANSAQIDAMNLAATPRGVSVVTEAENNIAHISQNVRNNENLWAGGIIGGGSM